MAWFLSIENTIKRNKRYHFAFCQALEALNTVAQLHSEKVH